MRYDSSWASSLSASGVLLVRRFDRNDALENSRSEFWVWAKPSKNSLVPRVRSTHHLDGIAALGGFRCWFLNAYAGDAAAGDVHDLRGHATEVDLVPDAREPLEARHHDGADRFAALA